MLDSKSLERSPHLAYLGGGYGRVSLMSADVELADHARDCLQLLVNVHFAPMLVRIDGINVALRSFDALVIRPRQTYAIPRQVNTVMEAGAIGFILVKAPVSLSLVHSDLERCESPVQALSRAARQDASQLVAEMLCVAPDAEAIARNVRALTRIWEPHMDERHSRRRQVGLQAHIARDAEAIGLIDMLEFASLRRAAAYGISERHFTTLFRRATRLSPKEFYNMRRLETAFALLAGASRSISNIGFDLGFSAPAHFTRFMRSNTGWTPSAYRAHLRELPPLLRPNWTHRLDLVH